MTTTSTTTDHRSSGSRPALSLAEQPPPPVHDPNPARFADAGDREWGGWVALAEQVRREEGYS